MHADGSELFAEVTVTLDADAPKQAAPISLALVLDTSGSMSGQKLEDARRAAHRLVDLLGEADELAVVSFGTDVSTFALKRVDAGTRAAFHAELDGLQASGSTNLSGGLESGWLALRNATGMRRLVLVSDGQPTVGLTTAPELASLVGRVHHDAITVTALGVGADIDGLLMQQVSELGGGMYGYLKDAGALEEILGREVDAARTALARNVVLELETHGLRVAEAPGRHLEWVDGRTLLQLADLRPHTPTRVLLRLESLSGDLGAVQLRARVQARLRGEEQLAATVRFEAPVLDELDAVTASRDEAVFSRGIAAVGSLRMVAAAAAYERGDVVGAGNLLDNARALFGMSADALAGEAEVDEARRSFSGASQQGRKELARKLERKKLTNFGRENEGY